MKPQPHAYTKVYRRIEVAYCLVCGTLAVIGIGAGVLLQVPLPAVIGGIFLGLTLLAILR